MERRGLWGRLLTERCCLSQPLAKSPCQLRRCTVAHQAALHTSRCCTWHTAVAATAAACINPCSSSHRCKNYQLRKPNAAKSERPVFNRRRTQWCRGSGKTPWTRAPPWSWRPTACGCSGVQSVRSGSFYGGGEGLERRPLRCNRGLMFRGCCSFRRLWHCGWVHPTAEAASSRWFGAWSPCAAQLLPTLTRTHVQGAQTRRATASASLRNKLTASGRSRSAPCTARRTCCSCQRPPCTHQRLPAPPCSVWTCGTPGPADRSSWGPPSLACCCWSFELCAVDYLCVDACFVGGARL